MNSDQVRAYWNGRNFSEENGYSIVFGSEWKPSGSDKTGPTVAVRCSPDGFQSILALLPNANRLQTLTLDEHPSLGTYTFKSTRDSDNFKLRLEFADEPFPKPTMQTLDLTTDLCEAQVGDDLTIHLRTDKTTTPGRTEVEGTITQVADSCGAVPDFKQTGMDYSECPVMSLQVDLSGQKITDASDADPPVFMSHSLDGYGNSNGVLDIIGASEPLEFHWKGRDDTPKLSVEAVTIDPTEGESWTVTNKTLPEVEFTPLSELPPDERIEQLRTAFKRDQDVSVSDATVQFLASVVTNSETSAQVTVTYESPNSEDLQSKHGALDTVESVYYADPNRTRHQIKFVDDSLYYLLIDPADDASSIVGIYSKSYSRHWDTDLGEVRKIDISY